MNKNVKKNVILAVAAMSVATLSMGIMANKGVLSANAEAGVPSFAVTGASVRISDDEHGNGIKFRVGLDKATYEEVSAKAGFVSGTLILPEALLGENTLNVENTDALNIQTTGAWSVGTTNYESIAYVYGIPEEYHATDLIAVGYYDYDELAAPVYTEVYTPVSMAWVAKQEYDNADSTLDEDAKANLKNTYMTYSLTTHDEAGEVVETKDVVYGDKLDVAAGEKAGAYFVGWYNQAGTKAWDMQNGTVKGNVNLYPKYYTDSSKYTQVEGTTNKFYLSDFNDPDSVSMFTSASGGFEHVKDVNTYNNVVASGIKIEGMKGGAKYNLAEKLDLSSFNTLVMTLRMAKDVAEANNQYSIYLTLGDKSILISTNAMMGNAGGEGCPTKPTFNSDHVNANWISCGLYSPISTHKAAIEAALGEFAIDGIEFRVYYNLEQNGAFILDEIILEDPTRPLNPWTDPSKGTKVEGANNKIYLSNFNDANSVNSFATVGGGTFEHVANASTFDKDGGDNGVLTSGIKITGGTTNSIGVKYWLTSKLDLNTFKTLVITLRQGQGAGGNNYYTIRLTLGDKSILISTSNMMGNAGGTDCVKPEFNASSVNANWKSCSIYSPISTHKAAIEAALGEFAIDGIEITASYNANGNAKFILDEIILEDPVV